MAGPLYETEIAALEAAASSGELTIEQNGERVTYRSMADLLAALAYFRGRAAAASTSGSTRSNTTLAQFEGY